MEPSERPEMKYFCKNKNIMQTGRIARVAAAAAMFILEEKSEKNLDIYSVMVSNFGFCRKYIAYL